MRKKSLLIISCLLLTIYGCSIIQSKIDKTVRDRSGENASFAYAFLDMKDAPIDAQYAFLKRVDSKKENDVWVMRVHDHIVYMENLPPGTYMISRFGGASVANYGRVVVTTNYGYDMSNDPKKNVTTFTINKPGVYFFGKYHYKEISRGRNDSVFDLEPMDGGSKSAKEKILPYTEGTKWHDQLQKSPG